MIGSKENVDGRCKDFKKRRYIQQNEFFRKKAKELTTLLDESKNFIKHHNLSCGMIGEEILRAYLSSSLTDKAKVSQGFIETDGKLSRQCDVIIYDCLNYAPLFSYGNIDIIPHESVFAVIEVKTSIDKKRFGKVLYDFKDLEENMRVSHKYLFLYDACKHSTIENYFYGKYVPQYNREQYQCLYDHDNYVNLPEVIVGLKQNVYLEKGHVQDCNRDMCGYIEYAEIDNAGKTVSCLAKFISDLYLDIGIEQKKGTIPSLYESSDDDEREDLMKELILRYGFGLFDF